MAPLFAGVGGCLFCACEGPSRSSTQFQASHCKLSCACKGSLWSGMCSLLHVSSAIKSLHTHSEVQWNFSSTLRVKIDWHFIIKQSLLHLQYILIAQVQLTISMLPSASQFLSDKSYSNERGLSPLEFVLLLGISLECLWGSQQVVELFVQIYLSHKKKYIYITDKYTESRRRPCKIAK